MVLFVHFWWAIDYCVIAFWCAADANFSAAGKIVNWFNEANSWKDRYLPKKSIFRSGSRRVVIFV